MWNWQRHDWPDFSWNSLRLRKAEAHFLVGSGRLAGALKHLSLPAQLQLRVEAISSEALTTSAIEGEILDRVSVQSSILKQLGLHRAALKVKPAEQGIAEMMVALCESFAEPLSSETLFDWHRRLCKGRTDIKNIGCYRTDDEPMQVVSGGLHKPRIHFEAPPSSRVAREMTRFVQWFNRTAPTGTKPLHSVTRAGIAHLYFESIHPFEDGNGRIGRAISEKALAQSLGQPAPTALAATILLRRKAYYAALEAANKRNEITEWLAWFAGIAVEGQRRREAHIEFVLDKTRLLDRLRDRINERQCKVLLRMLREGPDGFQGGLSAGNYATVTKASPATTTRDLANLVELRALVRTGELRHARYALAIPLREVAAVKVDGKGNVQ